MAPFSYDGGASDHWYAWAIDLCWITAVVGAGVFASAEDALREWRDAVGLAAASATLSSCPAGMTSQLLAPCLRTGPLADMLQGNEPRDLIREYYRLRRRARDLTESADAAAGSSPFDASHAPDAFLDWRSWRLKVPWLSGGSGQPSATAFSMAEKLTRSCSRRTDRP
jgi:hypothetical protein